MFAHRWSSRRGCCQVPIVLVSGTVVDVTRLIVVVVDSLASVEVLVVSETVTVVEKPFVFVDNSVVDVSGAAVVSKVLVDAVVLG